MTRPDRKSPRGSEWPGAGVQMPLELSSRPEPSATQLPPLEMRTHARARSLSVRVYTGGRVVVVVPPRTSAQAVQRFLGEHREWIVDTYRKSAPLRSEPLPAEIHLPSLNVRLPLRYSTGSTGKAGWREQGGELAIFSPRDSDAERVRILRDWLRRRAKRSIPPLLQAASEQTGLTPARLQFRLQKSRWGSCSSRGTVSLNACSLFLDAELLRYLFVHELCHLAHMNHSRKFWELVARFEPQWRDRERALDAAWRDVPRWAWAA